MARLANFVAFLAAIPLGFGSSAGAEPTLPAAAALARSVVDLSSSACYGLASGSIVLPAEPTPEALTRTIAAVEKMGLQFGITKKMLEDLGPVGQRLISRSAMGSKSLGDADVVLTVGGAEPGCRVFLLADAVPGLPDVVAAGLANSGWKPVPSMTAQRGALERRAFVRRDARGNPYLMNLMTTAVPGSRLRLFTTTVPIPGGVTIPAGY